MTSPLLAPEEVTIPLWASVSSCGKWRDDDPVLQASQGGHEALGRKGLCSDFCPLTWRVHFPDEEMGLGR